MKRFLLAFALAAFALPVVSEGQQTVRPKIEIGKDGYAYREPFIAQGTDVLFGCTASGLSCHQLLFEAATLSSPSANYLYGIRLRWVSKWYERGSYASPAADLRGLWGGLIPYDPDNIYVPDFQTCTLGTTPCTGLTVDNPFAGGDFWSINSDGTWARRATFEVDHFGVRETVVLRLVNSPVLVPEPSAVLLVLTSTVFGALWFRFGRKHQV